MNPRLLPFALMLAVGLSCGASHAAVVVQLELSTHSEPRTSSGASQSSASQSAPASTSNVPPDSTTSLTVTLTDNRIVVRSAGETTVYDFDLRKYFVIDDVSKTRVDYSLYDIVGFRAMELQNRTMMGKTLAAAKVGGNLMAPVDNENNLGIQSVPASPLQIGEDGTDKTFSIDSRVLFRRSLIETPVPSSAASRFAQFVRYRISGHPQALADLAASNGIPARVVMTSDDVVTTTRTLAVRSVASIDVSPIDVSRFPQRKPSAAKTPIDQALDRAATMTPEEFAALLQANAERRAAALQEGRVLGTFLTALERLLMTGDKRPDFTSEELAMMKADADVAKLTGALSAKGKEGLAEAIKVLNELKPKAGQQAYVLGIFEANDRALLGGASAAQALFLEALRANPAITSVYKDFGDLRLKAYDMPTAWRCWDVGRRLAPQVGNFEAVDRYEAVLLKGHPEFF